MMRLGSLLFFCAGLCLSRDAGARPAKAAQPFDLYQVSVNASDCKLELFLNGRPIPYLSGDASNGMVASAPLSAADLVKQNTLKIVVQAIAAEPAITVNVQGVDLDATRIVDTREPGDVLTLALDAKRIRAAKKKEFSAQFTANLRGYYEPFTDDKPVIQYATRLLGLLRKGDHDALSAELLPWARKQGKPGTSDDQIRAETASGLKKMLTGAVFKPVDPKQIELACQAGMICRPFVDGQPMIQVRPPGNAPDDFDPLTVGIAKVAGKVQVVRFMDD